MPQAVISGTGLYQPPHIITNAELVEAFNAHAEAQNASNSARRSKWRPQPCRS